jgi:hypothetical protein
MVVELIMCFSADSSFITALMRLLLNAPSSVESQRRFSTFAGHIVTDVIVPNLVWKGGRYACTMQLMLGSARIIAHFVPELQLHFVLHV